MSLPEHADYSELESLNWFSAENVQRLFLEFPLPLAVLSPGRGAEYVNYQFDQKFRITALATDAVREMVAAEGEKSANIPVLHCDGSTHQMHVHSVPLKNFTLLVFDDAVYSSSDEELEHLRTRLAELEKLSATDPLTGAWNRLPLERTAEAEINRSQRYHQPCSLIFFDVDRFKKINDDYGHAVGDQVLQALVSLVRENIRASDTIFRWGGEEFVVMATSTPHRSAYVLAEKLRGLVETHQFPGLDEVTISLGVAEFLPGDNLGSWLLRADKACYSAKAKGRNRVEVDPFGGSDIWAADAEGAAARLVWHDFYESGNIVIDKQHQGLFESANKVIAMTLTDAPPQKLKDKLDDLLESIRIHFSDEEDILSNCHFDDLDNHKRLHSELLKRAEALSSQVGSGSVQVGGLLEYLVYDVVAKHLLSEDRKYFPSLGAN